MTRARSWFLVAAIAAVGLACGSDSGSSGTGGSGGKGGASGLGGSAGMGAGGVHEGAGAIGTGGAGGGAGAGGGSGGVAGEGGHTSGVAGSGGVHAGSGGAGGHAGSSGNGAGGVHEGAGAIGSTGGAGGGGGGHAGAGGDVGGGGHAGMGGRAGAGGRGGAGGAGGTGKFCGGLTGATCTGVGEFCYYGNGQCGAGDQQGTCELSGGAVCVQKVVCGCDGNTYSSACAAAANGFDVMSTTSCIPGNGGTGAPCGQDTDCMSGYKCCVTGGTAGSPIACRQVPAGQSCPALP